MSALMRWSTVGSEDRATLVIHWNTETQLYLGRKQTDPILLGDNRLNNLLGGIERTTCEKGISETLAAMPPTTGAK
jgi:hypothetical protein